MTRTELGVAHTWATSLWALHKLRPLRARSLLKRASPSSKTRIFKTTWKNLFEVQMNQKNRTQIKFTIKRVPLSSRASSRQNPLLTSRSIIERCMLTSHPWSQQHQSNSALMLAIQTLPDLNSTKNFQDLKLQHLKERCTLEEILGSKAKLKITFIKDSSDLRARPTVRWHQTPLGNLTLLLSLSKGQKAPRWQFKPQKRRNRPQISLVEGRSKKRTETSLIRISKLLYKGKLKCRKCLHQQRNRESKQ
jgi:hypothetical protein